MNNSLPITDEFDFKKYVRQDLSPKEIFEYTKSFLRGSSNSTPDKMQTNTPIAFDNYSPIKTEVNAFVENNKILSVETRLREKLGSVDALKKAKKTVLNPDVAIESYFREVETIKENRKFIHKNASAITKLKNFTIDEWIILLVKMYRAVPNLLKLVDLDVDNIIINSARLSDRGMGTIKQLEELISLKDQKIELLNVYALNQIFAGLLESPEDQEIFLAVMQKRKKLSGIESQKLRTAYRRQRNIIKKFREYAIVHGMDRFWFFEHFSVLPIVRYYAKRHNITKKSDELSLT